MKKNTANIQLITAADCIDLRSRILRPGQPVERCIYPEDHFESSFHLGILINNKIVSNGTFIKNNCEHFSEIKNQYRLRGMATATEFQGLGYGRLILQEAEKKLLAKNCELLWFNARESAFKFYEKCGYQPCGEIFEIPFVGPHKVMYKKLI